MKGKFSISTVILVMGYGAEWGAAEADQWGEVTKLKAEIFASSDFTDAQIELTRKLY